MKTKEIKKLLKERYQKIEIPPLNENIIKNVKEKRENYLSFQKLTDQEGQKAQALSPEKGRKKAKWFYPVLTSGVALSMCLIFVCIYMFGGISGFSYVSEQKKILTKTLSSEVLALGNAISGLEVNDDGKNLQMLKNETLYNNGTFGNTEASLAESENDKFNSEYEKYKAIAKEVNNYIFTADALLKSKNMNMIIKKNKDRSHNDYKYVMEISFTDVRGYSMKYYMYYNVVKRNKIYDIDGILMVEDGVYHIIGRGEIKGEQTWSKMTVRTSETRYVTIKNSTVVNGDLYEYTYYEDGKQYKNVNMEITYGNDERAAYVGIMGKENEYASYHFSYKKQTIECNYQMGSTVDDIMIYVHDDYYLYVFEDMYAVKLLKVTGAMLI